MKHLKGYHFYASSPATWAITTPSRDLAQLIELMQAEGLTFNLYMVPGPCDASYDISFFQPQVKGTQWLGTFDMKKGARK